MKKRVRVKDKRMRNEKLNMSVTDQSGSLGEEEGARSGLGLDAR